MLPGALARTGASNIPRAASLAQSVTALGAIAAFALAGANPMATLFFWLGTTGGFGILVLLAVTSVAVIVFFARDPRGEGAWARLAAPVRPGAQGQGTGTALLHAHHATLDQHATPAYLEASSERSHAWYLRHGYTDTGQPFHLPGGGPPLWPMWRPAPSPPPASAPGG